MSISYGSTSMHIHSTIYRDLNACLASELRSLALYSCYMCTLVQVISRWNRVNNPLGENCYSHQTGIMYEYSHHFWAKHCDWWKGWNCENLMLHHCRALQSVHTSPHTLTSVEAIPMSLLRASSAFCLDLVASRVKFSRTRTLTSELWDFGLTSCKNFECSSNCMYNWFGILGSYMLFL